MCSQLPKLHGLKNTVYRDVHTRVCVVFVVVCVYPEKKKQNHNNAHARACKLWTLDVANCLVQR